MNLYVHNRPEGRYICWEPRLVKKRSILLREGETLTLEDVGVVVGIKATDRRSQIRLKGWFGAVRI